MHAPASQGCSAPLRHTHTTRPSFFLAPGVQPSPLVSRTSGGDKSRGGDDRQRESDGSERRGRRRRTTTNALLPPPRRQKDAGAPSPASRTNDPSQPQSRASTLAETRESSRPPLPQATSARRHTHTHNRRFPPPSPCGRADDRADSRTRARPNMQLPVTVLNAGTKRESGKKAQFGNIAAAKASPKGGRALLPGAKQARQRQQQPRDARDRPPPAPSRPPAWRY